MNVYATREDDGKRILVAIRCDRCGVEIKPYKDIATSGWGKIGWDNGPTTEKFQLDYCPECKR